MRRALIAATGAILAVVLGGCFKGTQSVRPDSAGPLVESAVRGVCSVGYSGGTAGSSRPAPVPKEGVTILVIDAKSGHALHGYIRTDDFKDDLCQVFE